MPAPKLTLPALAVHGGAGALRDDAEGLRAGREALRAALAAGHAVLAAGGSALDGAVRAVEAMEESGAFNAGRGSVRASDGSISLDAAVMDGRRRAAGAVAAVTGLRSPIAAARLVLERTPHVLLAGEGAERFAVAEGVARVPADYYAPVEPGLAPATGTVGAVALDREGALAAATSTGGVRGKLPGRVGDSPIVGAGTYADERCAVSATGLGEAFVRTVFAFRLSLLLGAGRPLERAAREALAEVAAVGGHGGCVALAADGALAAPFDTPGMFRGFMDGAGRCAVAALGDEPFLP